MHKLSYYVGTIDTTSSLCLDDIVVGSFSPLTSDSHLNLPQSSLRVVTIDIALRVPDKWPCHADSNNQDHATLLKGNMVVASILLAPCGVLIVILATGSHSTHHSYSVFLSAVDNEEVVAEDIRHQSCQICSSPSVCHLLTRGFRL